MSYQNRASHIARSEPPDAGLRRRWRRWLVRFQPLVIAVAFAMPALPARAHPHIFVDGGIDFVFREDTVLETLEVTWLYDEFETLYTLSSRDLSLNDKGDLDEADRQELVRQLSDWPDDFDGSAHLSIDGQDVDLQWPSNLDARMVDGRLELTFDRRLVTPLDVAHHKVETAFYESTYFYAFYITNPPRLINDNGHCSARVHKFDPDAQTADLRSMLSGLSREETPAIANVGALLADKVDLLCD